MKCDYCKPHADPRRTRLCHEGQRLWDAVREAGIRYINLAGTRDPAPGSVELAKEERNKAREAFHAHTGASI